MTNFKPAKLPRQNATALSEALSDFVRLNSLSDGLLSEAVRSAWNEASGVAAYTADLYRKGDTLYVTLTSSVVRSQLSFCKDGILQRLNHLLSESFAVSISGENLKIKKLIMH